MSFTEFLTTVGCRVHILPIQVSLDKSADLCAMIFNPAGLHKFTYRLSGDEYANWGNDDKYIKELVCNKEAWIGRPVYSDSDILPIIITQDDNRSVHNALDVAKIETLQSELELQKTKLNQIMSLLGKNNLI